MTAIDSTGLAPRPLTRISGNNQEKPRPSAVSRKKRGASNHVRTRRDEGHVFVAGIGKERRNDVGDDRSRRRRQGGTRKCRQQESANRINQCRCYANQGKARQATIQANAGHDAVRPPACRRSDGHRTRRRCRNTASSETPNGSAAFGTIMAFRRKHCLHRRIDRLRRHRLARWPRPSLRTLSTSRASDRDGKQRGVGIAQLRRSRYPAFSMRSAAAGSRE